MENRGLVDDGRGGRGLRPRCGGVYSPPNVAVSPAHPVALACCLSYTKTHLLLPEGERLGWDCNPAFGPPPDRLRGKRYFRAPATPDLVGADTRPGPLYVAFVLVPPGVGVSKKSPMDLDARKIIYMERAEKKGKDAGLHLLLAPQAPLACVPI